MLSNVYDICTVVAHLRVSYAQEHSVRIHQLQRFLNKKSINYMVEKEYNEYM